MNNNQQQHYSYPTNPYLINNYSGHSDISNRIDENDKKKNKSLLSYLCKFFLFLICLGFGILCVYLSRKGFQVEVSSSTSEIFDPLLSSSASVNSIQPQARPFPKERNSFGGIDVENSLSSNLSASVRSPPPQAKQPSPQRISSSSVLEIIDPILIELSEEEQNANAAAELALKQQKDANEESDDDVEDVLY